MNKLEIWAAVLVIAMAIGLFYGAKQSAAEQVASLEASPIIVVIDAGHGGMDGGAVSVTGALESQINLKIAQKADYLLVFCGFNTKMIRNSDISIHEDSAQTISEQKVSDLKQRVEIVNATPKAVLLSIHQNTFPESKYHGAQVFYADTAESQSWAEWTQNSLVSNLDTTNNRKAKLSSKVYLMEHINCDGILVECGFLSNETEELNLQTDIYQTKLALAMADGLCCWQQEENHEV
ncbi:MAG: N-acetylmuramoyl-L-alanine amidase [Eubacteriales bacterium]